MRIYIAGPYQHPDPVENTHKAVQAAEDLVKLGHSPYIPHLTLLWHLISPHGSDFWYRHDLIWLFHCEGLLRLPGKSVGADNEVAFAEREGIPVYHNIGEIPVDGVTEDQADRFCKS